MDDEGKCRSIDRETFETGTVLEKLVGRGAGVGFVVEGNGEIDEIVGESSEGADEQRIRSGIKIRKIEAREAVGYGEEEMRGRVEAAAVEAEISK